MKKFYWVIVWFLIIIVLSAYESFLGVVYKSFFINAGHKLLVMLMAVVLLQIMKKRD